MPKKVVKSVDDLTVTLKKWKLSGTMPEMKPLEDLHRRPVSETWLYSQPFNTLVLIHSLLNQVLGVSNLIQVSLEVENAKRTRAEAKFHENVEKSVSLASRILRERGKRNP